MPAFRYRLDTGSRYWLGIRLQSNDDSGSVPVEPILGRTFATIHQPRANLSRSARRRSYNIGRDLSKSRAYRLGKMHELHRASLRDIFQTKNVLPAKLCILCDKTPAALELRVCLRIHTPASPCDDISRTPRIVNNAHVHVS